MKRRTFLVLFAFVVSSLSIQAGSAPYRAKRGMVVSQSDIASQIGFQVIRDGGNAVDAAVATAFALAVTHPTAGN
ncbi:MAG: gamma-glutamyltransferase, partial [Vicinamibacterales bacterium]